MSIFKLPDLGEGLVEAEIVEWFFKEGDTVKLDENIVALETAKAIVDIPCPHACKIVKLYGEPGEIIHTGDPLFEYEAEDAPKEKPPESDGKESSSVVGELPDTRETVRETAQSVSQKAVGIKATPAVRAMAKKHDIDLTVVTPTGPDSTITVGDIERVVRIFNEIGPLEPLKGVRRFMAKSMSQAHAEVVPVTLNDDADISAWGKNNDFTVRLIRALVKACKEEPALNAWYDSHAIGRRMIKQVHLGLAVDTSDGLFVPVIRDVASYSKKDLRQKVDDIKALAHQRKVPPEDLRGNTITLSNFGSIGGKYANPVIVPPTVAILGAGRVYTQPVQVKKSWEAHTMLPLSLTFDHRSITGGEAGRFLQVLIKDLEKSK